MSPSLDPPTHRAATERLIAYPTDDWYVWECDSCKVRIIGPRKTDVRCSCNYATLRIGVCKHERTVAFFLQQGLRPIRPAAPAVSQYVPCRYCGDGDEIAEYGMCIDCQIIEQIDAEHYYVPDIEDEQHRQDSMHELQRYNPDPEDTWVPAHVRDDASNPMHTFCRGCGAESFIGITSCVLCSARFQREFGVPT